MTETQYSLRPAAGNDVARVTALVRAAYQHYVARIGMEPRPMTDDYTQVMKDSRMILAENKRTIVGIIVLKVDDEGFLIDNVAVDPAWRGRGIGRELLRFAEAEARRAGFDSIYLYTHEKMVENQALYAGLDYVEYDRQSQGNFSLVYMRKYLSSAEAQR